jgi:hypothetical protein
MNDGSTDHARRRKWAKRVPLWIVVSFGTAVLVVYLFLVAERNMNQAWPRDLGPLGYVYVYCDRPLFVVADVLHLDLTVFPDDKRPVIPILVSFFYHLPIMAFLFLPVLFRERRSKVKFAIISLASITVWLTVSAILWHDASI